MKKCTKPASFVSGRAVFLLVALAAISSYSGFSLSAANLAAPRLVGEQTLARTVVEADFRQENPEPAEGSGEEETEAAAKNKSHPLTEVYFNSGRHYLLQGELARARDYFRKALDEGEDEFAGKAREQLVAVSARLGDVSAESEVENAAEEQKPVLLYALADGWDSFSRENPTKTELKEKAREKYLLLAEEFAEHKLARKAWLKLSMLYMQEKKYEAALASVLKVLENNPKPEPGLPMDLAWFMLGQILEESAVHFDPARAYRAYEKVTMLPENPFRQRAQTRMRQLKASFPGVF